MSVAVITTVHTYTEFVPQWISSVNALTTQPDEIVIAATYPETVAGMVGPDVTVVKAAEPWVFGKYLNAAVAACTSDWVVWIGVDDTYRTHALDPIAKCDADVIAYGLEFSQGGTWIPHIVTADAVAAMQSNLVTCGSPFRRSLWERIPFEPSLTPYEDWAFWASCAHQGARFVCTGTVDYDYRQHADTMTSAEPLRSQIAEWMESLP